MKNKPIFILSQKDQHTTTWAGGTTTQLFIYPPEATYAQRDFLFRISTATVDRDHSVFTELPSFHRILMILTGNLTITHQDHYTKELKPLEKDAFEGDWQTTAIGKVTDFNLIMANNVSGKMSSITMQANSSILCETESLVIGLYLAKGKALVNQEYEMQAKDFIVFQDTSSIELTVLEYCEWVVTEITSLP